MYYLQRNIEHLTSLAIPVTSSLDFVYVIRFFWLTV